MKKGERKGRGNGAISTPEYDIPKLLNSIQKLIHSELKNCLFVKV